MRNDISKTRAVLAKVCKIGIPVAVALAVVYETVFLWLRFGSLSSVYHLAIRLQRWSFANDRVFVAVVGFCVLVGRLLLFSAFRDRPDARDRYWTVGGLCTLLAGAVGCIWALPAAGAGTLLVPPQLFVLLLWATAAVAVFVALSRQGLYLNASIIERNGVAFWGRILARTGIFFGVGAVYMVIRVCSVPDLKSLLQFITVFWYYMVTMLSGGIALLLSISLGYLLLSLMEKKACDRRTAGTLGTPTDITVFAVVGAVVLLLNGGSALIEVLRAKQIWDHGLFYTLVLRGKQLLFEPLVSAFTLLVTLRLLTLLRPYPSAHRGAMILGGCAVLSHITAIASLFLTNTTLSYETISCGIQIMTYVSYAVMVVVTAALLWIAVTLHRRQACSKAVFALPVVHLLPMFVPQMLLILIQKISGPLAMEVIKFYYAALIIGAVLSAVYYVALGLILARARAPKGPAPVEPAQETPAEALPVEEVPADEAPDTPEPITE